LEVHRILGNTVYTVLGAIVPGILALVLLKPIISNWGPESFTLLSFFWLYTAHAGIIDLGIGRNLAIELPKTSNIGRRVLIQRGLIQTWRFCVVGILITVFVFGVWYVFDNKVSVWLGLSSGTLLVLWLPIATMQGVLRSIFEGLEYFKHAAILRMFNQSILFIVPWYIGFIWNSASLLSALWILTAFRILSLCWCFLVLRKKALFPDFADFRADVSVFKIQNKWLVLSNVAGIFNGSSDRFVLWNFMGAGYIAPYIFSQDISTRFLVLSSSFALVLLPFFSKSKNKIYNHFWLKRSLWFILCIHILIGGFGFTLLVLWGNLFIQESWIPMVKIYMMIFFIGITANSMGHLILSALHSQRQFKKPAFWHVSSALIFILGMWLIVSVYKMEGVACLWSLRSVIDTLILYYFWIKYK
jgi:O-antigen/teichoic acid export membrane protein